jgi:hypothetical protein
MRACILRTLLLLFLGVIAAAATYSQSAVADPASTSGAVQGTFNGFSQDRTSIGVTLDSESQPRTIKPGGLADKFEAAQIGDIVKIEVDNASNPTQVTKVDEISRKVSIKARLFVLAASFLFLVFCAAALTKCRPQEFLIGVDRRYSNSQSQIALWFAVVATVYASAIVLRCYYLGWDFIGGVGLPTNLIVLSGLSAFTFGGAKAITVSKLTPGQLANPGTSPKGTGTPNLLTDLIQNDNGVADFGDFQMILIALAATIIFLLTAFHYLGLLALDKTVTLPDVDTTLLSGFGLGQGAYLFKKAALPPGQG